MRQYSLHMRHGHKIKTWSYLKFYKLNTFGLEST